MTLVVVQLITDATICQLVVRHNGCCLVVTPLVGNIVVVVGTFVVISVAVFVVFLQINYNNIAIVTCDVVTAAVFDVKVTTVAYYQTVHYGTFNVCPTDDTTTVLCGCTLDDELCQTVFDYSTLISYCNDTCVGCVAREGACYGQINVTTLDYTGTPYCDTCCMLLIGGDVTLHLQVFDDCMWANITEECCTFRLIVKGVYGDGVALTVEDALEVLTITTNHCSIESFVDVGRQDGFRIRIRTIHEFGKGLQVFCRSNLIDASHFGKCPCSCGNRKHHCGQTQIL